MRLQSLTGKFPTERPPDPDNGSPGTVGTVTGAEIQTTVLPRTTSRYRNRHASVQPAALSARDRENIAEHDGEHHACDVTPRTTALTPLRAIRNKCLWCCNGSTNEVALCPATSCSSWPFRFGHRPTDEIIAAQGDTLLHPLECRMTAAQFHAGRHSALMAIKRKCFDCSGASKSEVRNCAFKDCALHPFRQGKNPNRTYRPEERVRRAEHLAKVKVTGALIEKPVSIGDP